MSEYTGRPGLCQLKPELPRVQARAIICSPVLLAPTSGRAAGNAEATMPQNPIPPVIHTTHEAELKLGGIGAVLDGMEFSF
jgi:hypothetical protein